MVLDSIKKGKKKVSHIKRDTGLSSRYVYEALDVLMKDGLIDTYPATDDKRIKVYYKITVDGSKILNAPDGKHDVFGL